jgi:hypothetical protein
MEMAATCLVIDARKLDSLSIDGPALKVRMRMQSIRLFPLRRLSRIHVIGTLRDGLDSLLHCAEHQVPVAFFTYAGKLRCQMYFSVVENSIISHWLEHVDFDVEAQQIYEDWLQHQTLHLMSQLGYSEGARETRFKRLSEKLRNICNNKMGHRDFGDAMDWLIGIFTVHLSQLIVDHGLSNQSSGKRRLLKDISPVCEIWLIYFLAMAASKRKIKVSAQSMSDLYQQHADDIEYTARRMLSQLATRLESIV